MNFDIADWQRGAAALIGGAFYDGPDPALQELARSERLDIIREIIQSWRVLRIRTCCPLTAGLLEARGIFPEVVAVASENGASPYREAFAMAFLAFVAERFEDEDVVETARFEEEMIRAFHE